MLISVTAGKVTRVVVERVRAVEESTNERFWPNRPFGEWRGPTQSNESRVIVKLRWG